LLLFGTPLTLAATPDPWPGLVQDIFNNRPMNDGSDVIGIEMPSRAEDAAIVPVTLRTKRQPAGLEHHVGHRREPRADGGQIPARAGRQSI
jgi:hypothetical protein